MGVVEEPVDGGGGEGRGHEVVAGDLGEVVSGAGHDDEFFAVDTARHHTSCPTWPFGVE